MKRKCDDIDITTSAKPGDLEKILAENNIKYIETGLKHGTVTAVFDIEQTVSILITATLKMSAL